MTQATLQFLGAADTVTGSRALIRYGERTVLIDCGLFQGAKEIRDRNWQRFPVESSSIDTVLLTHAHDGVLFKRQSSQPNLKLI